jgi:phosphohistidine phosphatase
MDLILIRHARACDRDAAAWPDDARRPLTASGREEFGRLAKRLGRIAPQVELVESSGFTRAWQTAQILAEQTGWPAPSRLERLESAPSAEVESERIESLVRAAAALRGIDAIAWVGHEPMLSRLAARFLTGRSDGMAIDFKKGAACALRVGSVERCELLWMVTPRVIDRMRRRG